MDLNQVKEFIKKAGWGILATSDGHKVGARPMGGLQWNGKELWCASANKTDKIAQLKKVPYAEYCFSEPSGMHVRISGPCMVSTDNKDKLWLYKLVPVLKEYFPDPTSPDFVVIKMRPDNIRMMNAEEHSYTQIEG
jgi:general stress protein 26